MQRVAEPSSTAGGHPTPQRDLQQFEIGQDRFIAVPPAQHVAEPSSTAGRHPTPQRDLQQFEIGQDRFVAVPPAQPLLMRNRGKLPFVTAICIGERTSITESWLQETVDGFHSRDDVFRDEFLHGVVFIGSSSSGVTVTPDAVNLLKNLGTKWMETIQKSDAETETGPYFAIEGILYEAWKLYDDVQGAFMTSLIPRRHRSGPLSEFHVGGHYIQSLSVAVPSRLRVSPTEENFLAGLRVAVKDIFQIEGVRTSVCNRAYHELYPPPKKTAACINDLHRKGAVILGTTKLASFAATEEPVECVDFQAPWNPRGDGYQSPAGSSSGSGAAVASYEWLDISIGSDTSGSGRRPGHWNGCFAMRPSHGIIPVEGYIPSFRRFDVPTFFGRDIIKCKQFAQAWYGYGLQANDDGLPPSIVWASDYLSIIKGDQLCVIENFVADLELSLGVRHEKVSFNALWDEHPPSNAGSTSLQKYMKDACRNSFFHDDFHSFDQFREDYQKKFSMMPYVSPPVRWQWAVSQSITQAERDIAVARLDTYKDWFSEVVLQTGKKNTVVIIPIEVMSPRYRDEAPAGHFYPVGVPMLFLSPILGGPELTVPAGQIPYQSKVSGQTEHLPVAISLLTSPGRDLRLMDIARECLEKAGRPTEVLVGREMFLENSKHPDQATKIPSRIRCH